MSAVFPSSIVSLTNPTSSNKLNSPSHSTQHANENDEITAIETKVGIDSSAVTTTLDYLIKNAASNGGGHVQTAAKGGTGQTAYTKGDLLVAQSSSVLSKLAVGTDNNILIADSTQSSGVRWGGGKFGGTGSDGALTISSGTTTINCSNAALVIKNYTSISITGTAKLAFSNPNTNGTVVILKSQGAVTVTSSTVPALDVSSLGATGGAAATSANSAGSIGNGGNSNLYIVSNPGHGGTFESAASDSAGGTKLGNQLSTTVLTKTFPLFCGAGGGGAGKGDATPHCSHGGGGGASAINTGTNGGTVNGGAAADTGGSGGLGGGALYIECAGAYSCSSTISCAGGVGGNGTGTNSSGGGGGGGGSIVIIYGSLSSDTGTYTVSGGAGGSKVGAGNNGGGGGNGYSIVGLNNEFL